MYLGESLNTGPGTLATSDEWVIKAEHFKAARGYKANDFDTNRSSPGKQ
jgi:hypothetical protein